MHIFVLELKEASYFQSTPLTPEASPNTKNEESLH